MGDDEEYGIFDVYADDELVYSRTRGEGAPIPALEDIGPAILSVLDN